MRCSGWHAAGPTGSWGSSWGSAPGALISAVSYELAAEGVEVGSPASVAIGLAVGALTYFTLDTLIARMGAGRSRERRSSPNAGPALALGAFLDGIPEQLVLGIGIALGGDGVSVGLLAAVFVSNLPEAIGSASALRDGGIRGARILALWAAVAVICTVAALAGYGIADTASGELQAGIDGFAAGALLVMLVDSMIPEATEKAHRVAGLVTALGFAVAAGLSALT